MSLDMYISQAIANLKYPRKTMSSMGGTYGGTGINIQKGTVTISAGTTSVTFPHGLSGIPKVTISPGEFVFFRRTVTGTNIMIEIDSPQAADIDFDWMATL